MNTEPVVWFGRAGLLLLACTGALACVALLRRPCRRLFGVENAFLLWSLPPLAMLASQLPHPPAASAGVLSGAAWVVISASDALPREQAGGFDWAGALAWAWLLGAAASLARAGGAQLRYRARLLGAVALPGASFRWPVLRATTVDTGPALVGAWRPRIVVPADFAVRYAVDEQALILAHESTHARRRDVWWSLLAQVLASLFWFHPLAWWALAALRHDQELACDAAVLREHHGCRRSYAQAMLKTPAARQLLPVGCSWSSHHPLTERIAMLKSPSPGPLRRYVGVLASLALSAALTGVVYAASVPAAATTHGHAPGAREYQLDIQVSTTSLDAKASHAQHVKVALCMAAGEMATLTTHGQQIDAITRPNGERRVDIDLAMHAPGNAAPANVRLEGFLGRPLEAFGTMPGEAGQYLLQVTPRPGCPARDTAGASAARPVTAKIQGVTARKVAALIAAQAGLALVNPDALDEREVTLNFQQVPAASAMQLVAHVDGMHAVFDGTRVRFERRAQAE